MEDKKKTPMEELEELELLFMDENFPSIFLEMIKAKLREKREKESSL